MRNLRFRAVSLSLALIFASFAVRAQVKPGGSSAQTTAVWRDPSPHSVQFVTVDKKNNVRLEVLDWGGSGRPVVLLAGLGYTAHVFDDFAPKLTPEFHVYGITRRGFGASSVPASGYSADRLGDDVLAVLTTLKIERPVLIGHSIAGEELSSIGSRYPERVSGLIYLDAGYPYAYYDRSRGDLRVDLDTLQKKLGQLQSAVLPGSKKQLIQELLQRGLPAFERDLRRPQLESQAAQLLQKFPAPAATDLASFAALQLWITRTEGITIPIAQLHQMYASRPSGGVGKPRNDLKAELAILNGEQKYTDIRDPVLAIYAMPHDLGPFLDKDQAIRTAFEADDVAIVAPQIKAFERGVPSARVVILPHANHFVFLSNEADVLREIRAFIRGLH